MTRNHRILLLQPPFLIHYSPPIGLGLIQSALTAEGVLCSTRFLNVELAAFLGEEVYSGFESTPHWLLELLYAAELFPEHINRASFKKYFQMFAVPPAEAVHHPLNLLKQIKTFNQRVLAGWKRSFPYDAIGISANMLLMPSLFFAASVKRMRPSIKVILGGSQCVGEIGGAIMNTFSFIDWLVMGEGERAAIEIVHLLDNSSNHVPAGTCRRVGYKVYYSTEDVIPLDMKLLPMPDYDDFFSSFNKYKFEKSALLPVEAGRGCWWKRCVFCSVSNCAEKYRRTSDEKIVQTMEYLSGRYQILSMAFADNIQPHGIARLAKAIRKSKYDFEFAMALRADIPAEDLQLLIDAGLRICFLGVESFSAKLLEKMNKGTTVLDNIQVLKELKRRNVITSYNIISSFPGETARDRYITKKILESIDHLSNGMQEVVFDLEYGSPVYLNSERYGIKKKWPSSWYNILLPKQYRFSPTYYWDYSPILKSRNIVSFREAHEISNLSVRFGGSEFCIVYNCRDGSIVKHLFSAPYNDILFACQHPRKFNEFKTCRKAIKQLLKWGFLIKSGEYYLTTAVHF